MKLNGNWKLNGSIRSFISEKTVAYKAQFKVRENGSVQKKNVRRLSRGIFDLLENLRNSLKLVSRFLVNRIVTVCCTSRNNTCAHITQDNQIHLVTEFLLAYLQHVSFHLPINHKYLSFRKLFDYHLFPVSSFFELDSRPIAGHANLCPRSISTKLPELDVLISTVKHEILHALGFSVSLFAFYRDSRGFPLTPRDDHGKPALNEKYVA